MLISFEGIDGCGKSTQINLLRDYLEQRGQRVHTYREPGGTILSEAVRQLLLDKKQAIHPVAELLLFSAARAQLTHDVILPHLEKGEIVVLDRYFDSTTAYQGFGRDVLPAETVTFINRIATHGVEPDVTFYLKISAGEASSRRSKLGSGDRMEQSGEDFYRKVSEGYDQIASVNARVVVLDAHLPPEKIFSSIKRVLAKHWPESGFSW